MNVKHDDLFASEELFATRCNLAIVTAFGVVKEGMLKSDYLDNLSSVKNRNSSWPRDVLRLRKIQLELVSLFI